MTSSKVLDLTTAISRYVTDGMTVAFEGFGHLIPFGAAHEVIRQRRRGLTLCRMTPDLLADQLIGAGCVSRLIASYFASGSAGSLHEIRRRIENADPAPLDIEEYSHYGMVCRYQAGAACLPFFPLLSYAGSDIPAVNPDIKKVADPYGGPDIYVVPPLRPDVTIVHAQRADRGGNVQMWGIVGVQQEAAYAARRVIVTVEDIVEDAVVRSAPNRTVIPAHKVDAVVHCPGGAHPSYVLDYYVRDNAFYREWTPISRDRRQLLAWLDHWVDRTPDRAAYLDLLGPARWQSLRADQLPLEPTAPSRRDVNAAGGGDG